MYIIIYRACMRFAVHVQRNTKSSAFLLKQDLNYPEPAASLPHGEWIKFQDVLVSRDSETGKTYDPIITII